MPRTKGCGNITNYHYLLKKYKDDDKTEIEEERYFKTQKEIQEQYSMKKCSVYSLINVNPYIKQNKYKNIAIEKLCPPIPIFSQIETIPQGLVIN
tara:strand:- start:2709 stop:2993 length:285 start_codon:yes stop_codon:yes gene_type:complete